MGAFFDSPTPSEKWRRTQRFYLFDPEDGSVARSLLKPNGRENAVVVKSAQPIRFQPIDHHPIISTLFSVNEPIADGLLFSRSHRTVIFVELKNKKKHWQGRAVRQLSSTIAKFFATESLDPASLSCRRAYAANRSSYNMNRPFFALTESFRHQTGFTLHFTNRISIPPEEAFYVKGI